MTFSLRTGIFAILIAFTVNVLISPILIPFLAKLKFGQNVREDGPKTHLKKAGTPTMGGIIILFSTAFASLAFLLGNSDGLIVLFVTLAFGFIGFLDDYIKVVKKRSLGLRAYQKIIAQLAVTTVFTFYVWSFHAKDAITTTIIPFFGTVDLGIFWFPLVFFIMIGGVNSVNLTDGLDGLATGVTTLVATFFLIMAYAFQNSSLPIAGTVIGSLLGFLLFNSHPAKVFMGDTGSLALGGFVASMALLLKMPLFLGVVGIVYVIEALSVMIQVGYYKLTKQRFFKMAPIHHAFEVSGWSETKVVTLFYVITAIGCLIGFLGIEL